MKRTCVAAVVLALACLFVPFSDGAGQENSKVSELAHEGYWLKDQKQDYDAAMAMLDKPAPALHLSDWHGKPVDLKAAKGKGNIVLIDFWATWCGPCIAQIPHANQIAKKYADKGVVVFGACCPRGSEKMSATAADHGMEYPTGKMPQRAGDDWNIRFWPTYAVVDHQGNLRAIGLRPDYVEKVLDAVLEEQPGK